MKLTIKDKIISVKENKKSWTLRLKEEIFEISYNISKEACKDFESLKKFVEDHKLFESIGE